MAGISLIQPNGAGLLNAAGEDHPLPVTVEVDLICHLGTVGVMTTTWRWSLTKPQNSTATLSSTTSAGPSFVPDIDGGAYSISLEDIDENIYVLDISVGTVAIPGDGGSSIQITYSSYSAVRAAAFGASTPPSAFMVMGRVESGDGGGGNFIYLADSTASDDDGTILIDGDGHVFQRVYNGPVDARWFGMKDDARVVSDGNMALGSAVLTSGTAVFTEDDVGKAISVRDARVGQTLTGTVATTSGSRQLLGTSTKFVDELWLDAAIKVNGIDYLFDETLTGTVATTDGSQTLSGTGTKFLTELWVGAHITVQEVRYAVLSIANDTTATLAIDAVKDTTGITAIIRPDQTHALLSSAAGATASGLSLVGPRRALVTTVSSWQSATQVTLSLAASAATDLNAAFVCLGTDSTDGLAAAIAGFDHVSVANGSYLLTGGADLNRERVCVELMKGAKLYTAAPIYINNKSCNLLGKAYGNDFTFLGLKQPNVLWCGDPGRPIVRLTETNWASSAHVEGIMADANEAEGMTGYLLGKNGMDCSGLTINSVTAVDCFIGMNVRSGAQQNLFRGLWLTKRDSTTPNKGVGLLINGDGLVGTAAVTESWFVGGSIQSYRTAVQIGGPYGAGPAVIYVRDMGVAGLPPDHACAVRIYNGGTYGISGFYVENFPVNEGGDGVENHAIEIGAPGTVCEKVTINDMYLAGFHDCFAGYGWNGLTIHSNFIDIAGVGTVDNQSRAFGNYGGGALRRSGKWMPQAKVAPAPANRSFATELDDDTGFTFVFGDNEDSSNVPFPALDIPGRFHADTIDGLKTIAGTSIITGTSSYDSGAIVTALGGTGAQFSWKTPTGQYFSAQSELGLFMYTPDATSGTVSIPLNFYMRSAYWDGAQHQDLPISLRQFLDNRSATWKARVEFRNEKVADAFGAGIVSGWGFTESNELYLGPTDASLPLPISPSFAMALSASPEGSKVAVPGSIRTRTDGRVYSKTSGSSDTGWTCIFDGNGSITRTVRGQPWFSDSTEWAIDEDGNVTTTVATETYAYFALEVPHGSTITRVAFSVDPAAHANLPASMPQISLRDVLYDGTVTVSGPASDGSGSAGAYSAYHLVELGGLSVVVDNVNNRYVIKIRSEFGVDAASGMKILDVYVDTTPATPDRGAA